MALTRKQKATLLLASLEPAMAAEMVKNLDPAIVKELAVELAYLDAAGYRNPKHMAESAREFFSSLDKPEAGFSLQNFVSNMLTTSVGEQKAKEFEQEMGDLVQEKDPYISIKKASNELLVSILSEEHPQAIAVVLSELPAKRSSELLNELPENIRISAISRLANSDSVTQEAKTKIAIMVCKKITDTLEKAKASGSGGEAAAVIGKKKDDSLRRVAVILRNLGTEQRDDMIRGIKKKDPDKAQQVMNLMIEWDDIPAIADRSLQEPLRTIDAQRLALALHEAEPDILNKITSNMSERAVASMEEEKSLMSEPQKEDIQKAREKIVEILREANANGDIQFSE